MSFYSSPPPPPLPPPRVRGSLWWRIPGVREKRWHIVGPDAKIALSSPPRRLLLNSFERAREVHPRSFSLYKSFDSPICLPCFQPPATRSTGCFLLRKNFITSLFITSRECEKWNNKMPSLISVRLFLLHSRENSFDRVVSSVCEGPKDERAGKGR